MMKVVIAPDSFKGNLSARQVCEAVMQGLHDVDPSIRAVAIPLADGGEGTARAIGLAAKGEFRTVRVTGPLGGTVEAEFVLIRNGQTAVMDMASASGIELVAVDKLDPMKATSYGTGELIRAALDAGARELLLGIGGSATVDGGVGMAQALGFEFLDTKGAEVGRGGGALQGITSIRSTGADPRLASTKILVACDVTNPLLGPKGAAAVFGPQKGATEKTLPTLEAGLASLAAAWKKAGLAPDVNQAGDGAAGGLGAMLRVQLKAEMRSGARTVMEYAGFLDQIADADLVITGEGRTDSQTAHGKLCAVVADECKARKVPVALLSGALSGDLQAMLNRFDYAVSIACGEVGLEAMMAAAPQNLRFAAANLTRALRLGR